MNLTIRSHNPAWDAEYEVYTEKREQFRVKTSREGNIQHIRIFDDGDTEIGHVYQNRTGVTGECLGRELLTVDRRMGLLFRMIPVIESDCFRSCSLARGDIRKRDYDIYTNRRLIHVYPPTYGVVVACEDFLARPIEVLVLVLAIEAIAQYT